MIVKDLINQLSSLEDQDREILLSSDEEWNNLFSDILINQDIESNSYVLWPLESSHLNN